MANKYTNSVIGCAVMKYSIAQRKNYAYHAKNEEDEFGHSKVTVTKKSAIV